MVRICVLVLRKVKSLIRFTKTLRNVVLKNHNKLYDSFLGVKFADFQEFVTIWNSRENLDTTSINPGHLTGRPYFESQWKSDGLGNFLIPVQGLHH
jgi:hypothetical protein